MEEFKTTFENAVEFESAAKFYLNRNKDERSRLTLALNKILMRDSFKNALKEWVEDINEEIERLRGIHRKKDKDGNFEDKSYGEGQNLVIMPVFAPGEQLKFEKAVKEYREKAKAKTIEVKPHFVDVPANIEVDFIEPFSGFVFKPMNEEEFEAFYLAQGKKEEEKK